MNFGLFNHECLKYGQLGKRGDKGQTSAQFTNPHSSFEWLGLNHVSIQLCQSTSNSNTTKHSKSRSIISCLLSSVCGFMSYNNFSLCWPLTDYTFSYIQDPCMLREIMDIRVVFRGIRRCLHAPFSRPPYLQAQPTVAQHWLPKTHLRFYVRRTFNTFELLCWSFFVLKYDIWHVLITSLVY